jgi:hypothetical protein
MDKALKDGATNHRSPGRLRVDRLAMERAWGLLGNASLGTVESVRFHQTAPVNRSTMSLQIKCVNGPAGSDEDVLAAVQHVGFRSVLNVANVRVPKRL